MSRAFRDAIKAQLSELRTATTDDDVLNILAHERNPYVLENPSWEGAAGDGFFAGSGGDDDVEDALSDAGWERVWTSPKSGEAHCYFVMRSPKGSLITYCEGDVYRGAKVYEGETIAPPSIILDPLRAPRMDVLTSRNVPFMVLIDIGANLMEFWDLRYPMPHFNPTVRLHVTGEMPGQFVNRYSIDTIVGRDGDRGRGLWSGIVLDGGEESWTIDGPSAYMLRRWAHYMCERTHALKKENA